MRLATPSRSVLSRARERHSRDYHRRTRHRKACMPRKLYEQLVVDVLRSIDDGVLEAGDPRGRRCAPAEHHDRQAPRPGRTAEVHQHAFDVGARAAGRRGVPRQRRLGPSPARRAPDAGRAQRADAPDGAPLLPRRHAHVAAAGRLPAVGRAAEERGHARAVPRGPARGISIAPGRVFSNSDLYGNFLRINYSHAWTPQIEEAVKALARMANHACRVGKGTGLAEALAPRIAR